MEIVLKEKIKEAVKIIYNSEVKDDLIQIQETRKDFKGDFTLVVFPLLRFSKNTPEKTGETIGQYLIDNFTAVSGFNVIKGFLNLEISDAWWVEYFGKLASEKIIWKIVRFRNLKQYSLNTLHLTQINLYTWGISGITFLDYSLYRILSGCGHRVIKTNIVNDRGIHICKSMLAWQKFGNGETPESSGMKGDHLVGKYYVLFEKNYKIQIEKLVKEGNG